MPVKELGHVVLYVSDLPRSADFYRDVLGFRELTRRGDLALFSSGRTHHELLLLEVGGEPAYYREPGPGLCHIGLKIGDSTEELRQACQELKKRGIPLVGTADHGVTHSLYLRDPDGNEIELYVDVSDAWKKDPTAVLDAGTKPLFLDA